MEVPMPLRPGRRVLFVCWVLLFGTPAAHAAPAPSAEARPVPEQQALEATVKRAGELIDQWNGQDEVLEEARRLLDGALAYRRDYAPAHYQLARVWIDRAFVGGDNFDSKYVDRAFDAISSSIRYAPTADAYGLLARLEMARGEFPRAAAAIAAGKRLGGSTEVSYQDARLALRQSRPDDAIAITRRLIEENPENRGLVRNSYELLASGLTQKDDLDGAEAAYLEVIDRSPYEAWSLGNYASFLVWYRGDWERGIKYAKAALEIMNYGNARWTLGSAYYGLWAARRASQPEEAEKYRQLAERLHPDPDSLMQEAIRRPAAFPIFEALVQQGRDVNQTDRDGWTEAIHAAYAGRADLIPRLAALGADFNFRAPHGWTPLWAAAHKGSKATVEALIAVGADVNAGGYMNQPVIWPAIRKGHNDVVKLLIAAGVDVNRADTDGTTPIMAAAHAGNRGAAELLLAHGADLTAVSRYHETPYAVAMQHGHKELAELLHSKNDVDEGWWGGFKGYWKGMLGWK